MLLSQIKGEENRDKLSSSLAHPAFPFNVTNGRQQSDFSHTDHTYNKPLQQL